MSVKSKLKGVTFPSFYTIIIEADNEIGTK